VRLFLGIDTSAYTTSLALVDENSRILCDERKILNVPPGQRGLRQSEAVFQHIKNLPEIFEHTSIFQEQSVIIAGIAASAWPRRCADSYMPVFTVGLSQARVLSRCSDVPLYKFSHQEGHIMAGLHDNQKLLDKTEFLTVHFSGGTSEIMHVKRKEPGIMVIESLLQGTDLHAGQLVDRIGVAMGLPFPAGKLLEAKALKSTPESRVVIPSSVNEQGFSFSGAETRALQLRKKGYKDEDIAAAVFRAIANTLEKSILMTAEQTGINEVLLAGGVMANSLIKRRLINRLQHPAVGLHLHFAKPQLSTDNAVGTALLAAVLYNK